MTDYPIFVYGTLRPGRGNDPRWRGRADARFDGIALARGWRLVGADHWYPFAIAADDSAVGCLITPHPNRYGEVLTALDRLEGYPDFYTRVLTEVFTPDGSETAWIYTPNDAWQYADLAPVPGNDWSRVR